jgi:hypothetical protein
MDFASLYAEKFMGPKKVPVGLFVLILLLLARLSHLQSKNR